VRGNIPIVWEVTPLVWRKFTKVTLEHAASVFRAEEQNITPTSKVCEPVHL